MKELYLPADVSQADVYNILRKCVSLLTGGGSTSVPASTAAQLLTGICHHIKVGAGHGDTRADYEAGVAAALKKTSLARRRYDYLLAQSRDWGNITLRDTLLGLGRFFEGYSPRLFPLDTPGDIDYQLSAPVPDEAQGVDFILEYIRRLTIEERFLLHFDEGCVVSLLNMYNPEAGELAINVYDIVFTNAVGKAMLGKPDSGCGPIWNRPLHLSDAEYSELIDMLYARSLEYVAGKVAGAVDELSRKLNMRNADSLWYFAKAGESLSLRLSKSLEYSSKGASCELFI